MWTKVVQSGTKETILSEEYRIGHVLEPKSDENREFALQGSVKPEPRERVLVVSREEKATGCFVAITQRAWTKRAGSSCRRSSSAWSTSVTERSSTSPARMDGGPRFTPCRSGKKLRRRWRKYPA